MIHILQLKFQQIRLFFIEIVKGYLFQNVLVACVFNIEFIYVLAEWEKSAHECRVLKKTIVNGGLYMPAEKYLLADEDKQAEANHYSTNKEELLKLHYSSPQNVIKCIFGVCKQWF